MAGTQHDGARSDDYASTSTATNAKRAVHAMTSLFTSLQAWKANTLEPPRMIASRCAVRVTGPSTLRELTINAKLDREDEKFFGTGGWSS